MLNYVTLITFQHEKERFYQIAFDHRKAVPTVEEWNTFTSDLLLTKKIGNNWIISSTLTMKK